VTDDAKAGKVNWTTIYCSFRAPNKPEFRNALVTGRREMRQAIVAELLALASKAADFKAHLPMETAISRWR
jgi:hypothetical protein